MCVRCSTSLTPSRIPLPESFVRQHNLIAEDEALRAIHLAEKAVDRDRARDRLTFDEAIGLQWGLVARRFGELSESGPAAPLRDDGLVAAMRKQLPFELTDGQKDVLEVVSSELVATRPMNRMLQGEVGSGKTIVSVLAMLQMVDAGYQCALLAPTEVLAAQHARSIRDVLGPLAMAGQLGGADGATRVALLTGSMSAQQKKQVRDEVARRRSGHRHRNTRAAAGGGGVCAPRHGSGRRTAPVRGGATRYVARQGSRWTHAPPAGHDGYPDSAHRGVDRLRRPGDVDAARAAPRAPAHHHQYDLRHAEADVAGPRVGARPRRGPRGPPGLRRRVAHRRERQTRQGRWRAAGHHRRRTVRATQAGLVIPSAARPHARPAAQR